MKSKMKFDLLKSRVDKYQILIPVNKKKSGLCAKLFESDLNVMTHSTSFLLLDPAKYLIICS